MTKVAPEIVFLSAEPDEVGSFLRECLPADWDLYLVRSADDPHVSTCDYLIVAGSRVSRAAIEKAPRLKAIHKVGVGYDDIDTAAARDHDIAVAVCPLGSAEGVAEHTLALTLASLKCVPAMDHAIRRQDAWPKWEVRGSLRHLGFQTVGIVGTGRIGSMAAKLFAAFGCNVLAFSRSKTIRNDVPGLRFVDSLEELFESCSIVSLHVPLTSDTRGMVTETHLRLLGASGLLVNTARGEVVDQTGLVRALTDGGLGFAALDTLSQEPPSLENPLLRLPNTIFTPHIGGGGTDILYRKAVSIVRNIEDFHNGKHLKNRVTLPHPAMESR